MARRRKTKHYFVECSKARNHQIKEIKIGKEGLRLITDKSQVIFKADGAFENIHSDESYVLGKKIWVVKYRLNPGCLSVQVYGKEPGVWTIGWHNLEECVYKVHNVDYIEPNKYKYKSLGGRNKIRAIF